MCFVSNMVNISCMLMCIPSICFISCILRCKWKSSQRTFSLNNRRTSSIWWSDSTSFDSRLTTSSLIFSTASETLNLKSFRWVFCDSFLATRTDSVSDFVTLLIMTFRATTLCRLWVWICWYACFCSFSSR